MSWRMPAETEPQARVWMAFPTGSYVNHLVVNGAVIGCAFDDPNDLQAKEILEAAYPGREVVMIPAKDVFSGGGGIHCITQQQPDTSGRGAVG